MTVGILEQRRLTALTAPLVSDGGARLAAGAGALAILGLAASPDDGGVILCPFRRCTGGYCPGCGATRATGALVRGDLVASWHHHPFLVLAVAQLCLVGLWRSASGDSARRLLPRWQTPLLVANAAVLVSIWVARLAVGAIPMPFG